MSVQTIERDFHEKVSSKIRLAAEGMERFRVFTRFSSTTVITWASF